MQLPEEQQKWRRLGKCTQLKPEQATDLFFFGAGGSPVNARNFCGNCVVKRQCLHYAILHNEDGVWAGTTKTERDELIETGITSRILAQGLVKHQTFAGPEPINQSSEVNSDEEIATYLDPQSTGSDFPTANVKAS